MASVGGEDSVQSQCEAMQPTTLKIHYAPVNNSIPWRGPPLETELPQSQRALTSCGSGSDSMLLQAEGRPELSAIGPTVDLSSGEAPHIPEPHPCP